MSIPELQNGDVVLLSSMKPVYFDSNTGAKALEVSYSAGRGRKFIMLVLGACDDKDATSLDLDAILKLNGLQRIPE
jgi:hypothetical protein